MHLKKLNTKMHDILTLTATGSDAVSNFWNVQLSEAVHPKTPPRRTCTAPITSTHKAHFPVTLNEWGSFNDRLYAFVKALKSYLFRFILANPRCFIKSLCIRTLWKTLSFSFDGFRVKEIRLLRKLLTCLCFFGF